MTYSTLLKTLLPTVTRPEDLAISMVLGTVLDVMYPEHKGPLLRVHPVHTSYICALKLSRRPGSKLHGLIVWITCMIIHIVPLILSLMATDLLAEGVVKRILWVIISALTFKLSFSPALLIKIGVTVYRYASKGLVEEARRVTQGIVRRDLKSLDPPHVYSAAIESLAESLVDGIVSPLFYFVVLGPVGSLVQRIANTLDGALGFKTPELKEEGFFSARADDIINFIPARLSVITVLLCSLPYKRTYNVLSTWRKHSSETESPNAGHPMSAVAGLLGVWLEKIGHYTINPEGRAPLPNDIMITTKVVTCSTALCLAFSLALLSALSIKI